MKPMLAATLEDVASLNYPLLASPKLDGIRCLMMGDAAYSRNLKPIRNQFIQGRLIDVPHGMDGELIVGDPKAPDCFNRSTSGVMSTDGQPKFTYWVFDKYDVEANFRNRLSVVSGIVRDLKNPHVKLVAHKQIATPEELLAYEAQMLIAGFEGVMVRCPHGPYKFGRATLREGWLSKLKRFVDSEAKIIGYVERQHNTNEQTRDELGRSKRSSAKSGKVGTGTMGALKVKDVKTGVEFEIGTGFDDDTRQFIWSAQDRYMGAVVKYKSQPVGAMDKPRFPVFLGFRHADDI